MRVAAIVVAAGSGERFGARKQFAELAGRTVAAHAVAAARSVAELVVLVAPADAADDAHGADLVVPGGSTRAASVRAGLRAVGAEPTIVVVHDAARPLASPALFRSVLGALEESDDNAGAIPGIEVSDTVKRVRGAHNPAVLETLDREGLVTVQTPQAFLASALRLAHQGEPEATDDAALVEAIGGRVVVVHGDPRNRKVTTPDDLEAARAALEDR